MVKQYTIELEGQRDFYESYLKLIDSSLAIDDVLSDNTDGVLRGCLLEFKLCINDLNSVLFQSIKYLSSLRIKGRPVPANIILISLNDGKAYHYLSESYLESIEKVYLGSASKDNSGFIGGHPCSELSYVESPSDEAKLIHLLREQKYTKIHIDENNIVGWASSYYRQFPEARKSDFIGDLTGKVKIVGEIRKPDRFKEYIYPYEGVSNMKFQYLMDKLNDTMQKKNLGAFYTPTAYAEKALELVREAIARVPEGNDYIILDRCAGTGNLELGLTDEEKSHAVLSTVEYYEYKVLLEILGDKVRYIIPPTEKEDTFNMGLVRGADALSEEYINNPVIKQYVDNPACTIIVFENPPYAEANGSTGISGGWNKSYVAKQMKKEVKGNSINDLGNAFIWSAFKYYLRESTDSYVVFSPIKYWKAQHLIKKKMIRGFAFNRHYFHTNINACITAILWANEDSNIDEFTIEGFDIRNGVLHSEGVLPIKRVNAPLSCYYDRRKFDSDGIGIVTELNGTEYLRGKEVVTPIYNDNIVAYLTANGTGFDNPDLNSGLTICGRYDAHGFFMRKDNFLEKLPLFAASRYITYNRAWTERARVMKSADGRDRYNRAVELGHLKNYLLKVLLFTVFEGHNHILSFLGSDGRFYRNELCLDTTNGETIASMALKELKPNHVEKQILTLWELILEAAKKATPYDNTYTYGIYQISKELDTFSYDADGEIKYDDPELHGHLLSLKKLIKDYYLDEIVPTLFEYELLK